MFEPHKVAYRHPRYKTAYRVKKIIGWIAALPKSDEFSFTKVQDVVTNCRVKFSSEQSSCRVHFWVHVQDTGCCRPQIRGLGY